MYLCRTEGIEIQFFIIYSLQLYIADNESYKAVFWITHDCIISILNHYN